MAFDAVACRLMRRKWQQEGKRLVVLADDDTATRALIADRTSLRVTGRVNVAFLTEGEYQAWRQRRGQEHG
jgi:IS4 transposase